MQHHLHTQCFYTQSQVVLKETILDLSRVDSSRQKVVKKTQVSYMVTKYNTHYRTLTINHSYIVTRSHYSIYIFITMAQLYITIKYSITQTHKLLTVITKSCISKVSIHRQSHRYKYPWNQKIKLNFLICLCRGINLNLWRAIDRLYIQYIVKL